MKQLFGNKKLWLSVVLAAVVCALVVPMSFAASGPVAPVHAGAAAVVTGPIIIPTPVADIIDGDQVLADGYVIAGVFFGMIAVFVAVVYGKAMIGWLAGLATRMAHR